MKIMGKWVWRKMVNFENGNKLNWTPKRKYSEPKDWQKWRVKENPKHTKMCLHKARKNYVLKKSAIFVFILLYFPHFRR
jgi:hypothetical protein